IYELLCTIGAPKTVLHRLRLGRQPWLPSDAISIQRRMSPAVGADELNPFESNPSSLTQIRPTPMISVHHDCPFSGEHTSRSSRWRCPAQIQPSEHHLGSPTSRRPHQPASAHSSLARRQICPFHPSRPQAAPPSSMPDPTQQPTSHTRSTLEPVNLAPRTHPADNNSPIQSPLSFFFDVGEQASDTNPSPSAQHEPPDPAACIPAISTPDSSTRTLRPIDPAHLRPPTSQQLLPSRSSQQQSPHRHDLSI
ncbi:hypothetical protein ACLOJK_006845, partial [Asimina triloba]